jgi:two-component system response regulator YesN
MNIVIVDDEPDIIKGIEFLLNAVGRDYHVTGKAFNGKEGVEVVLEKRPDIVLADIKVPFFDGIEMIRRLKEQDVNAEFILLSGYAEFEYAKKAMALGIRYYLTKPLDEEELYDIIEKIRAEKYPAPSYNVVQEIRGYLAKNYAQDISLNDIADKFFMNPNYLSQLIKKKTGKTYQQLITELRIGHAEKLLSETDMRISEVCRAVGYHDVRHFNALFERVVGIRPAEYILQKNPKL